MEQSDDGTLKFRSTTGVNSSGGERLPDNALANVGSDKERDTGSQAIALLEELVKENNNEAGNNKLKDKKKADTSTEVTRLSIKTGQNIHSGLSERKDNSKHYDIPLAQLLCRLVK